MKKSKLITIGLLALSIASCHKKKSKHPPVGDWQSGNQSGYVSTDGGNGYQQVNSGFPVWMYYYMFFRPGYGYSYSPGAVYHYHSYGNNRISRLGVSEAGHAYHGSSRGGFGSSGHSVSA